MKRPDRRMPSMGRIVRYHGMDHEAPRCFKCRREYREWRLLDRAHVIDRFCGGLDHEANLRPLCASCHRLQPIFRPGEEEQALAWFADPVSPLAQIISRIINEEIAAGRLIEIGGQMRWADELAQETIEEWVR